MTLMEALTMLGGSGTIGATGAFVVRQIQLRRTAEKDARLERERRRAQEAEARREVSVSFRLAIEATKEVASEALSQARIATHELRDYRERYEKSQEDLNELRIELESSGTIPARTTPEEVRAAWFVANPPADLTRIPTPPPDEEPPTE